MKRQTRQNKILSILRAMQREVHVDELSEILDVSSITIRRDLDQLAGDQSIIRTHGGCLYAGRTALETEYHQKVRRNFDLKQSIGILAAETIDDGEVLLLNDGSTTFHLGAQLGQKNNLSVYTNSLALVTELSRFDSLNLFIIGGKYNSDQYSLRGFMLEYILEKITVDKVYIGAEAIDNQGNCYVQSPEEGRLTDMMLKAGRKKILLADHTKLQATGNWVFSDLSIFDKWITSDGIDETLYQSLSKKTQIIKAPIANN